MLSRLLSILRTLVAWTYLGAITVLFVPIMLLLLPSRRRRICAFNVYGRLTGRVMVFFAGAALPRGVREGMKATHPAIYVSNHTSYLDNFLASWAAPIGTIGMAQSGTVWVPFFGNLYSISGNVLVNRRSPRAAAAALATLIDLTQRFQMGAMLWPEGGRSSDGRLRSFKRGFVHLALATRLPIVPVVVSNAHRCWPKGSPFTQFARVNVQILAPISTQDWTPQNLERHVQEVRARFVAALPADQKPLDPEVTAVFQK
jgi:1-acyl-sn-glycerol-3-phosphate acyltransferase